MSINKRKHIRLTLNIPAFRYTETGEKIGIIVYQISIGGCFIEWDENIEKDQEFRLEIRLPNKNWLPLQCQTLYVANSDGIGIKFLNITQFEQELVAQIMSGSLAEEGIPLKVDPFSAPKLYNPGNNQFEVKENH
ncbi:MAG: PilZ domain-containing protein [Aridibacter sp.]